MTSQILASLSIAAKVDPTPQASNGTKRVLIVEDDPLVTEVITDILTSLGLSVITAQDGSEAIALFESMPQQIVCVILDFDIPGLHSSRVYSRFREINNQVKVLLSSGYPECEILPEFPFEQVDGFIPKPYDPQVLIEEISKLADEVGSSRPDR